MNTYTTDKTIRNDTIVVRNGTAYELDTNNAELIGSYSTDKITLDGYEALDDTPLAVMAILENNNLL